MKFKLGQKVEYKKIIKRLDCTFEREDMPEDFTLEKRKVIDLVKSRVGYVIGSRKLVFKLMFGVGDEGVECYDREWKLCYKVAYDMAHTNYVLEEDLILIKDDCINWKYKGTKWKFITHTNGLDIVQHI